MYIDIPLLINMCNFVVLYEGSLMLELLNEYAMYVNITWGREAAVKV
jgi:hypothetical protein